MKEVELDYLMWEWKNEYCVAQSDGFWKPAEWRPLLSQVLLARGLHHVALDPHLVSVTKHELAAACDLTMDEMECAAIDLLNANSPPAPTGHTSPAPQEVEPQSDAPGGSDEESMRGRANEDLSDELICVTTL